MKRPWKVTVIVAVAGLLCGAGLVLALNAQAAVNRYEAEAAPVTCDGKIAANHSGYSGAGFCDVAAGVGAAVQLTADAASAATTTLGIRYADPGGGRPADISVNGVVVHAGSAFDATGAWNVWATKSLAVPLAKGRNTIRIVATTAAGLANIDYLEIESAAGTNAAGRQLERLGRGVVAVRAGNASVLVGWRLLGLDPEGIGFNVYRSAAGGAYTRLNASVLTGGTNYTDTTANLALSNSYQVRPVVGGVEQAASGAFTLTADHAVEPVVRVPLRPGGAVKFVWVGDLDGDGEYDYVLDRQTSPQTIEAYRSNGQFLWSVDLGPNSTDQDNIEGGSATVDVGHNDGVTVYDLDGDGRAEVAVRIANGVTFGNGTTFTNADNNRQFIAILDGRTGAARATAAVPTDYLSDGPMYARFGVGYLDGVTPSLVAYMKNRIGNGSFNLMMSAWKFTGSAVSMQWKWLRGNQDAPDGHNTRVIDVDGDGRDEVVEIGFVLNGNGTLKYSLAPQGIQHGDRFHLAKMDPNRPGLQGYGVQQDNPSGLRDYYYDAATGTMIWKHVEAGTADVGRGVVGDIDPRFPGMEAWAFSGVYNAATDRLTEAGTALYPWPQTGLFWDGDTTMELLNDGKFEKWNPGAGASRLVTTWKFGAVNASQNVQPAFHGDILGDWREEVVYTNGAFTELIIFTTNLPTDTRLYTLAHNPAYRNDMTVKGYMQSHHVDYFLGAGMSPPPRPAISYAGS
jgi:rhamnogalacturonan endolyase